MKKILGLVVVAVLVLCCSNAFAATFGPIVQWTTGTGANNHYYQAVTYVGGPNGDTKNWNDASATAVGLGGYLATIASLEENSFIWTSGVALGLGYDGGNPKKPDHYFLGGHQDPAGSEPSGGWHWEVVPSETWGVYTNWKNGSLPADDDGLRDYMRFAGNDDNGKWEAKKIHEADGFIIEYSGTAIPEPMSLSLLGLGLLGAMGAGFRRKK